MTIDRQLESGATRIPLTREEEAWITETWEGHYIMRGRDRVSGPYGYRDWAMNVMEGKPMYQERLGWIINK